MQIPTVSYEVIVSAVVHLTGPLSEDNFRIAFRFMESDCIADTSSNEHTHSLPRNFEVQQEVQSSVG